MPIQCGLLLSLWYSIEWLRSQEGRQENVAVHNVTSWTLAVAIVGATTSGLTLVKSLTHQSIAIPDCFKQEQVDGLPIAHSFSEALRQKQTLQPAISAVVGLLKC